MLLFDLNMITPEAIISDSDGTLVNTLHLIRHGQYAAFKTYFTAKEVDPADIPDYETYEELLNQTVGGSARDTLERTVRLAFEDRPHYLEYADFDKLHDLLNPIQDKIAPEFVKAYEGLPSLLNRLGDLGVKLAIFTSGTPHHIVRNIGVSLPELGLDDLYKSTDMSDTEKLRLFEKTVKEHARHIKSWRNARPQHWHSIRIGSSQAHLDATINSREQQVGMELWIADNKDLFHKLFTKKDEIEEKLGFQLDWQELPDKKGSRVFIAKSGDFLDATESEELIKWLVETADNFSKVFPKYL